jgi:two-component system sensor histidine kinase/response regulator
MFQPEVSGAQLRLLAEAAPFGMYMTDSENRFIYTNPRWSEMTGISADDVAGRPRFDVIKDMYLDGLIPTMPRGSGDESERCYRTEIELPGSAPRVLQVNSRAVCNPEGVPTGWIGTVEDVTAEARAEAAIADARDKATEASRLKSEFLANISHEIRTPINGVIGMTELLLETDLDTRQREYAEVVLASGDALLRTINEILDFSRLERGTFRTADIEFAFRDTVEAVALSFAEPAQAKGLELVVSIADSVPAVVRGDPARLRHVITNLIGNAITFTHAGEVVLRVSAVAENDRDAIFRFEVCDTGDGVAPDRLGAIFQPFVQADGSMTRKYEGAGLGLSVCAQLVALMGGECQVLSELGVGSKFSFTIRVGVVELLTE